MSSTVKPTASGKRLALSNILPVWERGEQNVTRCYRAGNF